MPRALRKAGCSGVAASIRTLFGSPSFHVENCQGLRQTSEMLLPTGSEQQINSGFVGVAGAFEIYRGSVRSHRMANLRVILR